MPPPKIGLLNFSEANRVKDHIDSIQELLDYAKAADELGFTRFWMAEHYSYRQLQTWNSPDMLVPLIAANTDRIKVGIAGSLIAQHNTFDIATNYKLLAGIFPNRIDLGLAKGTQELNTLDNSEQGKNLFGDSAKKLMGFLIDEEENFYNGLVVPPLLGPLPSCWLLTGSYTNLTTALELGLNVSRSLFHLRSHSIPQADLLIEFKEQYRERHGKLPEINLAIAGCCLPDERKAKRIFKKILSQRPFYFNEKECFVGSTTKFRDKIDALTETFGVSEIILLQLFENESDRMKGIEGISECFELNKLYY